MKKLDEALKEYISLYGEDNLIFLIKSHIEKEADKNTTLTIVVNSGIHPLQDILHRRGDVFFASTGNIDVSTKEKAELEFKSILLKVAQKLQSENWKKVYIVPFGPSVLSMLIKSLVYKILNFESTDVLHAGSGIHYDINIDIREIAIESSLNPEYKNKSL